MSLLAVLVAWALLPAASAAESNATISPYMDAIREELKEEDAAKGRPATTEGYTDGLQKKIRQRDEDEAKEFGEPAPGSDTYIQRLELEDPTLKNRNDPSRSYTDTIMKRLPEKKQGGAIEAVLQGKSDLKPRKEGPVTGAFGFKMGASITRDIQGGDRQVRPFDDVYGDGWAPEVQFLYEYQPFHSETWGNFGIVGTMGLSYFNGFGKFPFQIPNTDVPGELFPLESQTRFQFYEIPIMIGVNYRMNLFKILKPFVMAGPMAIAFFEARNDEKSGTRGYSKAFLVSAGVAIPLDWLSADSSWELYSAYGIKQYYLTIDYSRITSFASEVNFDASGVSAGVAFEF